MPNDKSGRGYPLPHPDNVARDDAARIRSAIGQISDDLTLFEERAESANVAEATETASGVIRLATSDEATAGTVADAVVSVKRAKDMIAAAITAALTAVQQVMAEQLADTESDIDQAIDELSSSVASALAGVVRYDKAQSLADGEKSRALSNIGAQPSGDYQPKGNYQPAGNYQPVIGYVPANRAGDAFDGHVYSPAGRLLGTNDSVIISVRTVYAGDLGANYAAYMTEPFGATAMCSGFQMTYVPVGDYGYYAFGVARFRYLQYQLANGIWVNFVAA